MSSPSQSPPDAAHFPQHPALRHLLRGPHGSTSATQWTVQPSCLSESTHRSRAQPHLAGYQREATSTRQVSVPHINSVEEGATVTLLTSEVDDPRIGRLASPLLEQKREAGVILAGVYHSQRENSTVHTPQISTARPVARLSHKRKTSRDRMSFTGRTARQRKNSS